MEGVCFFNTAKVWGGGEKWHLEASTYLHAKGHSVLVVAHADSVLLKKLKKAGIPCMGIKISNWSFINPFKRNKVFQLLKKHRFKTIVMNLSSDVKIAGSMAKKAGIARIIYRRGSAIPIKDTIFNRYLFKNVLTEILANSKATKLTVLENNDQLFPKDRIRVIPNGIATSKVPETNGQEDKNAPILLTLGRLEYQKNQAFLMPLAAELKKRKLTFKMRIGGEGSLRPQLEAAIQHYDLSKEVELSGFVDKPLDYISQASIFLLPSLWEGFGYVLAEAALCKKPIVAFDLSSNPELVLDGKTGYLVTSNDLTAFADKVETLIANRNLRLQFGEQAYQHIRAHFDKDKQLLKIEDYLIYG